MDPPRGQSWKPDEGPTIVDVGPWSFELDLRRPSRRTIIVTVLFVLIIGMLANSVRTNGNRADDWRRRAVAAEEVVGGLRVVIGERSQALNQRTRQANSLVGTIDSSRGKLRASKVSLSALARRQRLLESENARSNAARRNLQRQRAALVSAASALNACSQGLEAVVTARGKQKATPAERQARLEQCGRAQARFRTAMERVG